MNLYQQILSGDPYLPLISPIYLPSHNLSPPKNQLLCSNGIRTLRPSQFFEVFASFLSCCSVAQSCPTLCSPMDCSTPGFPVLHHLPELVQVHVHWVGDAIQSSHPLSSPTPPALKLAQHQSLSTESAFHIRWPKNWHFIFSISPPMNIQHWFPLGLTALISLLSKGLSRVFSNTTVQGHQFFSTQPFLLSSSHICTWLLEKS